MKEIKAIIQPHMLNKVVDALHNCAHYPGLTVSDCQGQGRGLGKGGHFEATNETIFFAKKVKVEVFCADDACEHLVDVIQKAAHTGNPGDGVVVVIDVDKIVRVRTGEHQDQAV
jgi:nitrogen regulatory protein P-II 1